VLRWLKRSERSSFNKIGLCQRKKNDSGDYYRPNENSIEQAALFIQ
jgi:hypothetical protein